MSLGVNSKSFHGGCRSQAAPSGSPATTPSVTLAAGDDLGLVLAEDAVSDEFAGEGVVVAHLVVAAVSQHGEAAVPDVEHDALGAEDHEHGEGGADDARVGRGSQCVGGGATFGILPGGTSQWALEEGGAV